MTDVYHEARLITAKLMQEVAAPQNMSLEEALKFTGRSAVKAIGWCVDKTLKGEESKNEMQLLHDCINALTEIHGEFVKRARSLIKFVEYVPHEVTDEVKELQAQYVAGKKARLERLEQLVKERRLEEQQNLRK
jgi:hypothetical protein